MRPTQLCLLQSLIAGLFIFPAAQAKETYCTSAMRITSVSGSTTLVGGPHRLHGMTAVHVDYGSFHLLQGDMLELLLFLQPSGTGTPSSAYLSRNGNLLSIGQLPFLGTHAIDVTDPGIYAGFCSSDFGESFQFTVYSATPGAPVPLGMRVKARLEGAMGPQSTHHMQPQLSAAQLIPCDDPYTALGEMATMGPATVDGCQIQFLQQQVVDWVQVQLWNLESPSVLVASANGLMRLEHSITATDGSSPLLLSAPPGDYRVRIVHRNHIPAISDQAYSFRGGAVSIGFHQSVFLGFMPAFAFQPACTCSGAPCRLLPGNALLSTSAQRIAYIGAANDRDPILIRVGGNTPTNVVSGYFPEDINMDGLVKYVGTNNDRDAILEQLGGNVLQVILEQQP